MIKSRQKHSRGNLEFAAVCRQYGLKLSCHRGQLEKGGLPGLSVEVRRTQRLHLEKELAAVAQQAHGAIPVLVHRKDHQCWNVTLPLADFLRLYRAYLQTDLPDPKSPESAAYPDSNSDSGHLPAEAPGS